MVVQGGGRKSCSGWKEGRRREGRRLAVALRRLFSAQVILMANSALVQRLRRLASVSTIQVSADTDVLSGYEHCVKPACHWQLLIANTNKFEFDAGLVTLKQPLRTLVSSGD